MMDAKQWALIESHFERIADLPLSEKTSELEKIQTQIPEIYEDLIALLAEDESPHTLFHLREVLDKEQDKTGEKVANYRLLKLLGKGGMGEVYLAERASEDFQQEVALKLVRTNYKKKDLNRYFQQERQILAGLKHKNIAALYDGGISEEGMPYFTMEYVEGLPFGQYIDQHTLTLKDQLNLFLQICDAVAYSHQKLLAHLDLKPGNIIVTEQGECKLLDFGIAGMPEEKGKGETKRFTPAYASPEQLSGESLSTSSDIYSLGIMLYELVYDKLPRKAKENTLAGWKALSANLSPNVFEHSSGDLSAICQKALQEKPEDRYTSVEQLGQDIRAYLAKYPISLKKQNKSYVLNKYLNRNRAILGIVTIAILALGTTIYTYTERVKEERNVAKKEAAKAREISDFMYSVFDQADPYENQGKEVTAKQLLEKSLQRLPEELAGQPELYAEMIGKMASLHVSIGNYPLADSLTLLSIELFENLYGEESFHLAESWIFRADYFSQLSNYKEQGLALEKGLGMLTNLYGPDDSIVIANLDRLATNYYYQGDFARADSMYRLLIHQYQKVYPEDKEKIVYPLTALGEVNNVLDKLDVSDSILRIAVDMVKEVYPSPHMEIAYTHAIMSSVQYNRGNYPEALKFGKIARSQAVQVYGAIHKQSLDAWLNMARVYTGMNNWDSAISVYDSVRVLHTQVFEGTDHRDYGEMTQSLANVYLNKGDLDKAEPLLLEAKGILEKNLKAGHPTLMFVYYNLGRLYLEQGRYGISKEILEKGLAICSRNLGEDHPRCGLLEMSLGTWYVEQKEEEKGSLYLEKAYEHLSKWPKRYADAIKKTELLLKRLKK